MAFLKAMQSFAEDVSEHEMAFNPDQPINTGDGAAFGVKRKFDYNGSSAKRQRLSQPDGMMAKLQNLNRVLASGKSPVSILNELGLDVRYETLAQTGPPHCPIFNVDVRVLNMKLEGKGKSKREAKTNAARAALLNLYKAYVTSAALDVVIDTNFFLDELKRLKDRQHQKIVPRPTALQTASPVLGTSSPAMGASSPVTTFKSPVNYVLELFPNASFTLTYGDGSPVNGQEPPVTEVGYSTKFKVQCNIDGKIYEGYGASKKLAKIAASKAALAANAPIENELTPSHALRQDVADKVAQLILEKFAALVRGNPLHAKRKVLAGIVVTREYDLDTAKVICVTTGTKCISGSRLSIRGYAVNDCHAEVLARRCLQRYIYDQLYRYTQQQDPKTPIADSELEPCEEGGYRWRDSCKIHVYISTAPCGDGRIFSPTEKDAALPDKHPNRFARGQLRTKIESGEGTIPVYKADSIQTLDGILQGSRLLTMSCSDKLARWCLCGMQGALLSTLVRPVYPHSLVLGSLLREVHIYRAIHTRISQTLAPIPAPWSQRIPLLARTNSIEARVPSKNPGFSVNWTNDRTSFEVVNCTSGRCDPSDTESTLCKQYMYGRWLYVLRRLTHQEYSQNGMDTDGLNEWEDNQASVSDFLDPDKIKDLTYAQAKQSSRLYQRVKMSLYTAFEKAGLGRWVRKPMEQELFTSELNTEYPEQLFR